MVGLVEPASNAFSSKLMFRSSSGTATRPSVPASMSTADTRLDRATTASKSVDRDLRRDMRASNTPDEVTQLRAIRDEQPQQRFQNMCSAVAMIDLDCCTAGILPVQTACEGGPGSHEST